MLRKIIANIEKIMVLAHSLEDKERTQDVRISKSVTFDSMLLTPNTLKGLRNSGFYKPSPIQLHGIPLGKCGFDLLLEAKAGTGKTAVFSVIALEKLDMNKGLQAIILAPTREIAAQICDVIKQIGSSYEDLHVEVVMGGLPVQDDIAKFKKKKVHIVVGSPGRLRSLVQEKHIDISAVRLLVLDEADKLMEKSFLPDINYIFSVLPKQKQVIMSSATYPEKTKPFIEKYVQSVQHICPDSNSILLGIKQKVTVVTHNSNIVRQTKLRFEELLKILTSHSFKQCLIFCNYQARIAELHKLLIKEKWPAQQLHGQQEQLDRLDAIKSLQEYKCRILISTDLAARGIDASNVDLVINFEPPFGWETYLHRIGRAGRFGTYGVAVTILSEGKEQENFTEILETIKGPLNVENLWKDDESAKNCVETPCTSSVSIMHDVKTDEKYDKLWKALTTNGEKEDEDVISFNSLNNSFEKMKIESFNDLLNSIESYEYKANSDNEDLQHHLPMQAMSVLEYSNSIQDKEPYSSNELVTLVKQHSSERQYSNETDSKYNTQNLTQNPATSDTLKDNLHPKTQIIILDEHNEDKNCSMKGNLSQSNRSIGTCAYEKYDKLNIDDSLLSAGLPLEFRSTKNKCKVNYTNNRINKKEKDEQSKKHPEYRHKKQNFSLETLNFISNQSYHNMNMSNTSQHKNYHFCQYNAPKYHDSHGKCTSKYEMSEESTSDDEENNNYDKVKMDYYNWYNNLKFRVKQLELTIYLDEMSKK